MPGLTVEAEKKLHEDDPMVEDDDYEDDSDDDTNEESDDGHGVREPTMEEHLASIWKYLAHIDKKCDNIGTMLADIKMMQSDMSMKADQTLLLVEALVKHSGIDSAEVLSHLPVGPSTAREPSSTSIPTIVATQPDSIINSSAPAPAPAPSVAAVNDRPSNGATT